MSAVEGSILIVEDDQDLAELLVEELEAEGYRARACGSAEAALDSVAADPPDLVISDLQLPGADGLAFLARLRERDLPPSVLMISAYGTVDRAVAALKAGADNFLTKPLDMDHLTLSVQRLLAQRAMEVQLDRFRRAFSGQAFHQMSGKSGPMRQLYQRITQVAKAEGPVLISGESGTGKDLVARAVHAESRRPDGPFLAVNCAGIPPDLMESEFFGHSAGAFSGADKARPGLFREAENGTLFLDEIGEMPIDLQAKLLRALQDGTIRPLGADREQRVDVRVVAATNVDLLERVADGRFREDLYYRLETFALDLPPLRERAEDIDLLAVQFIEQLSAARGRSAPRLAPEALKILKRYHWPGNVRELRNAIERAVTFCHGDRIEATDLPDRIQASQRQARPSASRASDEAVPEQLLAGDMLPSLDELRQRYVRYVLDRVGGNKRRAAALLGVGRRSLYRWLEDQ